MKFCSWRAVTFLMLAPLWLPGAAISAQPPPSLFLSEPQPTVLIQQSASSNQRAASSRLARVNPAVLQQLSASNDEEVSFRIRVDSGAEQVATVRKLQTSDDRYRVLGGSFEGEAGSQIIFVTDGEYLAASFQIAGRGSFQILPKGRARCELNELPSPTLPLCSAVPGRADASLIQERIARSLNRERTVDALAAQNSSDLREIEVMMLYTPQSRTIAGDVAAMEAQARLSIEEANAALANSNAGVRFRVVHMAEVAYEASGILESDLDRLTAPFDGIMDEVHAWRDLYKADLVCLIVERSDSTLEGLGHFASGPEHGFSVVAMPYLTGYYLVAHELGHNLGCDHDRENAVGLGAFPFSYGYRFDVDGVTYRTVMAYNPGSLLPYYSNPDITFLGVPLGIAAGSPNESDNARTIREMAAYVDSYRGLDVQITQPSRGISLSAKEPIELAAEVRSDEGPVVGVEFFDGESLLGQVATAPYRFSWIGATPGLHEISARTGIVPGVDVRSPVVRIGVRPANDDFADRLPLSGTSAFSSAILYAATSEEGEPLSVRNAGGTAWWTWQAPQDGIVRVSASVARVTQKNLLAVFSGAALEALQPVQINRTSNTDLLFHATAGEDYEICLAGGPDSSPVWVSLTMQPPPANDDLVNAQRIAVAAGTITGSTVAATAEPGEPSIGSYPLGHSIWFRWSPPVSGRATVALGAGMTQADFGIYTGADIASLKLVANSTGARSGFPVEGSHSYFIGVDGAFQPVTLVLNLIAPATNDNFAQRNLAPLNARLMIDPSTATREPNEPVHGATARGHSLWWTWHAASNGGARMVRQILGSTILPDLSVAWYTGNAFSNLVRVASFDFTNNIEEGVIIPFSAGTNYVIALDSGPGTSQEVEVQFQFPRPNDSFRAAQAYASGGDTGSTLGATAERGEPTHGGVPATHSVWWTWGSVTGKTVSVTVDSAGKILPRLSVYSGTTLTNLLLIAENSINGQVVGPTVTFSAEGRTRYNFAIDETISSFSYSLTVQGATNPANDNFALAQPLSAQVQSVPGSTIGATLEPDEPDHLHNNALSLSGSAWYTWTASSERDVTILALARRTTPPYGMQALLPEPVVAVYEGASPAILTQIGAGRGSATFRTRQRAKYNIAVSSLAGQAQDFSLTVVDLPPNDRFQNATPLSGNILITPAQLRSATRELDEPNHAGTGSGHSLWWNFTPVRSGLYVWGATPRFYTGNSAGVSLVTAVYTGTDLANLIVVASNAWPSLAFSAEAEKKYYLLLDLSDPRISDLSTPNPNVIEGFLVSLSRYPILSPPVFRDDQHLQFSIGGSFGETLSLQSSSDFLHWEPVRQIQMPTSDYKYSEPTSLMVPQKFFRVLLLQ
jgi:hypothetical protein